MITRSKIIFLSLLFSTSLLTAQEIFSVEDVKICNNKFVISDSLNLSNKPINEIIIEIAKSFIGVDYEAAALETGESEQLVIHLTGLDCYTFLEASLVFARCIKMQRTDFVCFKSELENIRYRNGKLLEYPSRLHYFSDWIYEMEKRGIAKDVTKEIGGVDYYNSVNFMSANPNLYTQLSDNPDFVEQIKIIESEISSRKYYHIPEEMIEKVEDDIESGDIIGITTNIDGLDISHTGIAVRMSDGRIYLLHAPNVGKKIQISEEPLSDYIKKNKSHTGIIISRPTDLGN